MSVWREIGDSGEVRVNWQKLRRMKIGKGRLKTLKKLMNNLKSVMVMMWSSTVLPLYAEIHWRMAGSVYEKFQYRMNLKYCSSNTKLFTEYTKKLWYYQIKSLIQYWNFSCIKKSLVNALHAVAQWWCPCRYQLMLSVVSQCCPEVTYRWSL